MMVARIWQQRVAPGCCVIDVKHNETRLSEASKVCSFCQRYGQCKVSRCYYCFALPSCVTQCPQYDIGSVQVNEISKRKECGGGKVCKRVQALSEVCHGGQIIVAAPHLSRHHNLPSIGLASSIAWCRSMRSASERSMEAKSVRGCKPCQRRAMEGRSS